MRYFHLFLFLSTDLHTSHVNVIFFYFFHSRWCMTQTLDLSQRLGFRFCVGSFLIFNLYFLKYIFFAVQACYLQSLTQETWSLRPMWYHQFFCIIFYIVFSCSSDSVQFCLVFGCNYFFILFLDIVFRAIIAVTPFALKLFNHLYIHTFS